LYDSLDFGTPAPRHPRHEGLLASSGPWAGHHDPLARRRARIAKVAGTSGQGNDSVLAFYLVLFALPGVLIVAALVLARWTRPSRSRR